MGCRVPRAWRGVLLIVVWMASVRSVRADEAQATILRVFLTDGTAVASFGEYARIGDRIVFSMLLGAGSPPRLQLVNLPASAIDWASTSRYADAARYAHYLATRSDADYASLTNEVAKALNQIALASDTHAKLDVAMRVRRLLAAWPAEHFGYRAGNIQEMAMLLEEAISELRASTGERQFALNLVATAEPPSTVMLLPSPTASETIEQGLAVAKTTDIIAERVSLLQTVATLVDEAAATLPGAWVTWARESVRQALEIEASIERQYGQLVRRLLGLANGRAARADVRGIESVVRAARRADARLGGKRPDQMAALMVELDQRLDAARRLRLARDQWTLNIDQYRAYRRDALPLFEQLDRTRADLEQIRSLAGPDVETLESLLRRLQASLARAGGIRVPIDLQGLHATLVSALHLGANAARLRQAAARSASLPQAWDASAAAAGSLMLSGRARSELDRLMRPPELP
ncbi:MAG: hypothetical protein HYS05_00305 [Acidobacteria bacterium]|nr:hypothetical protein [Acidobacteriota bacterium]